MTLKNHGDSQMSTFADYDGDGDLDMFASNTGEVEGSLWVAPLSILENTGSPASPSFGSAVPVLDINGNQVVSVGLNVHPTACDLDEDGDVDLMIGENAKLFYYENNGDNRFEKLGAFIVVEGEMASGIQCTFGDLNSDGKTDIVYATHDITDEEYFYVRWGI